MTFKQFKLIIIVILIIIIIYFFINNRMEHLINNSEVELSFQTLAQLLSNNKISVKPKDTTVNIKDIEDIINNISKNVDAEGRLLGYLPSNIIYDNGRYRDTNNRFTINPDGTFSSNDFIFQEGNIKRINDTIYYDPTTKKLKYNNVTYDEIANNLKENNNKYLISQEGNLSMNNGDLLYTVDGTIRQKNNRYVIDNTGKVTARDLVYKLDGEISARDLVYKTDGEISARDLVYKPDGEIKAQYNSTNNTYKFVMNNNGVIKTRNSTGTRIDNLDGTYTVTRDNVTDVSNNLLVNATYIYNQSGVLIDSPNFYDEIIIMKRATDVGSDKPLHIRKVFLFSMDGYNGIDNSGTIVPIADILGVYHENMDDTFTSQSTYTPLTKENLLIDDTTTTYTGRGKANTNNVIRIKFTKGINLASIRIENRLDFYQNRIHKTIVYFRKNGVSLAKINLDAPTDAAGNLYDTNNYLYITNAMRMTNFPIYNQIIDILRKRGKDINTDPIYKNDIIKLFDYPGPSLYRFFGTGLANTIFINSGIGGAIWTGSNFQYRPMIILPVPTIE